MGQAHLEFGQPVEDAAEDEVGGGDGGVEGITEEIAEVERLQALGAHDAKRMQEHGQAEGGRALEDRKELRIGQLAAAHVGAHVDATDAREPGRAIELFEGAQGILHGQHGAAHEPVRVRHVRGVVEGGGETRPRRAVRPVHHRHGEGEGLDAHALAIHRADAKVQVHEARLERRRARRAEHDDGALGIAAVDPGAEGRARFLDEPDEGLWEEVRVDVDTRRSGHGSAFYSQCPGDGSLKADRDAGSARGCPSHPAPEPQTAKEERVKLPGERFDYSPMARAMLEAGWEFMAHGVIQGAMHLLPDQRAAIRQSIEMLTKFTGRKPKGWLGPGLTETWETLDHLAAEGIEYVSDWVNDDQPYEIRTAAGRLVSVPYSIELNDIPMMVIQHHTSSEWLQRVKDQFDRLYAEGAKNPRVMALAVHPYISGVPHRIKYFEAAYDYMRKKKGVWFTTGEDIYEWYRSSR